MDIFSAPSYYSLFLTGIIWVIVLIMIIKNYSLFTRNPEKMIIVLTLFGILVGVHGLIHLGLENYYNFNPMNWLLKNKK